MKIITYNVNGIRSALSKNWLEWLKAANPDVVCLQEIKATPDQLTDLLLLEQLGYEHYWNPAEKKGYSGTAIFREYSDKIKLDYPNLVISGDYNICHRPIDIHNPKSNVNSSGFLPAEREWMEDFINSGYIDSFRHFNNEPHNYTWWSFRANARAKNLGWRIDYNLVSEKLRDKLKRAAILPEARHSDHCPVLLELDI